MRADDGHDSSDECDVGSEDEDSSDEEMNEFVPQELRDKAKTVTLDLLPPKSRQLYTAAYNAFKKWRKENKSNCFCEDVLLAYLSDLSKHYKSSTLWTQYSMLKTTIMSYDQIDIKKYTRLQAYLKKLHRGYKPDQSLVFTKMQVSQYLSEAPNEVHLAIKVALIFGTLGAMRRSELAKLKVTEVSDGTDAEGSNYLLVKVKNTKTKVERSFVICDKSLYDICKQYMEVRTSIVDKDRFFMRYTQGRCVNQPIGINNFGGMPKKIAKYLQLPNSKMYTGHCFRRTAATFLVAGGGDILALKRLGTWKSNAVAESYVADLDTTNVQICNQITKAIIINDPNKFGLAAQHMTHSVNNSGASNELGQLTRVINPVYAPNIGAAQSMDSDSATTSWNQFESVEYEDVCADKSMIQAASFMTGQAEQAQCGKKSFQKFGAPQVTSTNDGIKNYSSPNSRDVIPNSSALAGSQKTQINRTHGHVPLFKKTLPLAHQDTLRKNQQSHPKVLSVLAGGGKTIKVTLQNQLDSVTAASTVTSNGSQSIRFIKPLVHDSAMKVSSVFTKQPSPGVKIVNCPQKSESNSSNGICGIENIDPQALQDDIHPAKILLDKVPLATESGKRAETTGQNNTIAQNAIIETSTFGLGQRVVLCEPRLPILYHPDVGLYINDEMYSSMTHNFVFNNCNVTVDGSYSSYIFNNCKITDICGSDKN